jgi:hypothetical protein
LPTCVVFISEFFSASVFYTLCFVSNLGERGKTEVVGIGGQCCVAKEEAYSLVTCNVSNNSTHHFSSVQNLLVRLYFFVSLLSPSCFLGSVLATVE